MIAGLLDAVEPGALDRLDGVLDEIGQHLGDQPVVEPGDDRRLRQLDLDRDFRQPHAFEEHRLAHGSVRSACSGVASGMRAKEENSSTMRPMSPTWRMMVLMHLSKTSKSSASLPA